MLGLASTSFRMPRPGVYPRLDYQLYRPRGCPPSRPPRPIHPVGPCNIGTTQGTGLLPVSVPPGTRLRCPTITSDRLQV